MRTHLPRHRRGCRFLVNLLSLDQHRNNSTGTQLEGPVSNNPQNRGDFTRVRRNRDKRLFLGRSKEDFPQSLGTPNILRATRLSRHAIPQLILLGEPMLNGPVREHVVDVAATTAVIAGVDADSFTEVFLHGRLEGRAVFGHVQARES